MLIDELKSLMELDYEKSADYLAETIVKSESEPIRQKCKAFASRGLKTLLYHCSSQLSFTFEDSYLKAIHAIWTITPDHPVAGKNSFKDLVADSIETKISKKFGIKTTCRIDSLTLCADGGKLIETPLGEEPIYEEVVLYRLVAKLEWN